MLFRTYFDIGLEKKRIYTSFRFAHKVIMATDNFLAKIFPGAESDVPLASSRYGKL